MKIKNVQFLARANIKGNKKSNSILALMIILVLSLTLIPCFSISVTNAVNIFKEDYRARFLQVDPCTTELTDDVIGSIKQVEHVEDIYMLQGMRNNNFDILSISDENGTYEELQQQMAQRGGCASVWSLIGDEKRSVIAGKTLDETPAFSCIIPSLFYPFDDDYDENGKRLRDLGYIDGESLVGKTLTVRAQGSGLEVSFNYNNDGIYGNEFFYLPALEYKLKIVGVYYADPSAYGYYNIIYVSEETGRLIQETALEEVSYYSDFVKNWWNTPSLRCHYLLVDDYDNIDYVYNKLTEMGIDCAPDSEMGKNTAAINISRILSTAGFFLIAVTAVLCIVNLIQSATNSLNNRKGEIGLLKAIGYTNKQVFACLYYEQLALTLKGFLIGGGLSAIFVATANYFNNHNYYASRLYIVDWKYYLIFLAVSLCIAITVPLLCQLLSLNKLTKIQPKDAMG